MSKQATQKKVSSKKTVAKKAAKPSNGKLGPDSHIRVVAGSKEPKRADRKKIKAAVPAAGISARDLCEKQKCRMVTLAAMIRRGFIEVRE